MENDHACCTETTELSNYAEFREACICEIRELLDTTDHTHFEFESSPKRCNLLELAIKNDDSEFVDVVLASITAERNSEVFDSSEKPLIVQAACRGYSVVARSLLRAKSIPVRTNFAPLAILPGHQRYS